MTKRQKAIDEHYEAQWDGGKGSHHPDYEPEAMGHTVAKATRETEELLNAIIKVSVHCVCLRATTALEGFRFIRDRCCFTRECCCFTRECCCFTRDCFGFTRY
jgi:hypothetical protein